MLAVINCGSFQLALNLSPGPLLISIFFLIGNPLPASVVPLVDSCSELSVEEQQGDSLPLDMADKGNPLPVWHHLVNSCSELSVEEQQGDALPLDHASFPYSSDNFRVPYIVTNFRKNTEESVGLEAMQVGAAGRLETGLI